MSLPIADEVPSTAAGETAFARTIEKLGWSRFYLYGVPFRISDGTVLMTGYRREQMPGTAGESNDRLNDQSFVLRSEDDGFTWGEPVLIDRTVFDTNECMIAESSPGMLVSFSRTLRGRTMWTATSRDGGRTWSDLEESGEPGDSPCMLAHSSGLLVMTSRDTVGTRVAVTADQGRTWSRPVRVPPSNMTSMVELRDGRVYLAGQTGWTCPTWIHADTFRVTPDGPVAAR